MKEKELQTRFTKWLKSRDAKSFFDSVGLGAVAFELKISHTHTLARSSIKEHQVLALAMAAGLDGFDVPLVHKISDSAIGYKPFDCVVLFHTAAFLVVGFNDGEDVVAIPAKELLGFWQGGGHGLTLRQAQAMGSPLRLTP